MDGHEHTDVVNYCNNEFLLQMAQFEAWMVHYEGPEMWVEPKLEEGEKEIISQFHDECCFHVNDQSSHAWWVASYSICQWLKMIFDRLRDGEQPLCKKVHGWLIHLSDFINPETGWLVVCDTEDNITHDGQKIIHPGSDSDPWWDTKQLLTQVEEEINIFETAHPNKQALFIFDQSLAHASLPPDALKAF